MRIFEALRAHAQALIKQANNGDRQAAIALNLMYKTQSNIGRFLIRELGWRPLPEDTIGKNEKPAPKEK